MRLHRAMGVFTALLDCTGKSAGLQSSGKDGSYRHLPPSAACEKIPGIVSGDRDAVRMVSGDRNTVRLDKTIKS